MLEFEKRLDIYILKKGEDFATTIVDRVFNEQIRDELKKGKKFAASNIRVKGKRLLFASKISYAPLKLNHLGMVIYENDDLPHVIEERKIGDYYVLEMYII